MRRIRYAVAMSPDGYIAGPKGQAHWGIMDPDVEFSGFFEQFDTFLLGRRTFEVTTRAGQGGSPGTRAYGKTGIVGLEYAVQYARPGKRTRK